jgi:hypothetical protein
MSHKTVVVEGLQCLAHAWWIDTLLYLLVCVAVIKYALPLARGCMMVYRIVNSVMEVMALKSALATAKPLVPPLTPVHGPTSQAPTSHAPSSKEPPRGVMRRPVVKPMGSAE